MRDKFLRTIAFGFFLIIVTLCLSFAYSKGYFVRWQNVGTPPKSVDRVLAVDDSEKSQGRFERGLVEYTDGEVGGFSLVGCEQFDSCWSSDIFDPQIDIELIENTQKCHDFEGIKKISLPDIGRCYSATDVMGGTQFIRYIHIVETEQGEFLFWSFLPGQGAIIILIIGFFISLVGSFIFFLRA